MNGKIGLLGRVQLRVELVPEQIGEQSWWKKQMVEPAVVSLLRLKHVARTHVQVRNLKYTMMCIISKNNYSIAVLKRT